MRASDRGRPPKHRLQISALDVRQPDALVSMDGVVVHREVSRAPSSGCPANRRTQPLRKEAPPRSGQVARARRTVRAMRRWLRPRAAGRRSRRRPPVARRGVLSEHPGRALLARVPRGRHDASPLPRVQRPGRRREAIRRRSSCTIGGAGPGLLPRPRSVSARRPPAGTCRGGPRSDGSRGHARRGLIPRWDLRSSYWQRFVRPSRSNTLPR